jgi:hypothetical protein
MRRLQTSLSLGRVIFAPILLLTPGIQAQSNGARSGNVSLPTFGQVVHVDGRLYPFTAVGVQAAISTACTGRDPGKVILPPRTISDIGSPLLITSSNCSLEGQGKNVSILQASSGYSGGGLLRVSGSNIRLVNFDIDGDREGNPANNNIFDCLDATGADIVIDGVRLSNCQNQGLYIYGASSNFSILKSEFDHDGSNISIEGTGGIRINPGGAANLSNIQVGPGNLVHDNNVGIAVLPPTSPANQTSEVSVFENLIYSNASDGVVVSGNLPNGGSIVGFSARGNSIWCNGWTGTAFTDCSANYSPNYPGYLQKGSAPSSSGVGIDIIQLGSGLVLRPIIQDNQIHDNTYEGLALTTYCWSRVSTRGTTVKQVGPSEFTKAACPFNTNWKAGEAVVINGVSYLVASVATPKSLILRSPGAPNQRGAGFAGPASMHALVANNQVSHDGSGTVGPCFFDSWSSDVRFSNNIGKHCNLDGYSVGASNLSFNNDEAISNGAGRISGRTNGFGLYGCFACHLTGVYADDPAAYPTQTTGLALADTTSNTVTSGSDLRGSTPYTDLGTNNVLLVVDGSKSPPGAMLNKVSGVYQSKRKVAGCTTAPTLAGSCATPITVAWPTPFVDTNYSVSCTPSGAPTNVPGAPHVSSKSTSGVIVNYVAITAAAASWATIDCEATRD